MYAPASPSLPSPAKIAASNNNPLHRFRTRRYAILAIYRVIKRSPPTLKTRTYIINIIMMIDFFSSQIFSSYTIKMMLYIYWELYIFYSMAPKVRLKSQSKYVIKPELFSSRRVLYRNWTVPLLNLPEPKGPFMPRSV